MRSSVLVLGVSALLVAGCVSLTPGTPPPTTGSATATPGVTTPAPATPAPTSEPTGIATAIPTPTPTPTTEPTETQSQPPTEAPTATPGGQANDLVFLDNMDDPASGWDTFSNDRAEVVFDVGSLEFAITTDDTYAYSGRDLGGDFGVVVLAGEFIPSGNGSAGLLCIDRSSGTDLAYGAVFTQDGSVNFVGIDNGVQTILESNEALGIEFPGGESTVFGLGCSATSTGALRLTAFGNDTGPLATYQVDEGASSFDSVAAHAEAATAGFVLDVSAVAAYGIPGSSLAMTPEATELLTHVPSDFQAQCYESPAPETEVAVLVCNLQQDGAGAEILTFAQYSSAESMNDAYNDRVATYGVDSEGSCRNGPNETTWSINDVELGRVQCAPQLVGIRFDWTDERLNILSTLIDFEGDYTGTYNLWLDAGPNE